MVGRISLSLVALFGVWMLLETTARGQNLPKDRQDNPVLEEGFSQPVFLAPKRTQMRMLVNARKLLELQRYSQAVRMLHRVLIAEAKESRDEDYFFLTGENEFETDRLQSRLDLLQATSTEDLGSLSVGDLTLRRKFLSIKLAGSNLHINDLQEKIEKESPPSSNDRSRRQLKALLAQQTRAKLSKASYEQQIAAIDSLKLHPGPQPQTDAPVQSSQLRKQVRSHQSLRTEARRLLGRLPEAARESYELQFGIDAQQMLDRAVEAGNIEAVAEVQRRYFHTRAGYQAMMLLGHYHLDQDAPIMAALCFREVYESPVAAEYEPAISMLLATALQQSGQTEEAEIVLFLLQEKYPQKKITIGGQVLPQSAEQEDPLAWLAGLVGQQTELQDLPAINWTMFRGNAARTAVGSASRPLLLRPLWRQRIAADADSEQDIAEQSQQYADRTVPAVPALQPLAVGEVVFMRTPGRLAAVDLESGKLIWQVETTANEKGFDAPVGENIGTAGKFSNATLRRRVWLDKTFGSMSSDGERLFVLEEFGSNDNASERVIINRLGKRRFSGPQYNVLAARSVSEAQGKLLWSLGGPHAKDPEMKKAFFLGPPLPLQGRIYQLVELAGEVRLLVLDSRNGEQLWSQQLAVVQQSERFMGKRRTGGISPSYAEGVLICPTGVGGIVAVDLMTRNLRWGHQYPEAPALRSRNPNWNRPTTAMALPGPEEIWADSCAIISDGFVLVTPAESNHLHCLSLQDGTPLWRVEREKLAYLAGVHAGKAILIGTGQITAIDMRTGKVVDPWPLPLPSGSLPSGRGYQAGDRYYLPLRKESKGEVISVDLKNAKIVEHSKSGNGTIPGNLICHRRLVISQNSDWLQSFHQLQPLKADVAQTLSENPRDPVALLRRGEILVDEGNSASAVELFRTAAGLFAARADDFERQGERASHADALASAIYARQWLFQGLLDGIKKDFEAYQDSIPEIETLITGPRERIDYLRVVAAGYDRAGQIDAALDTYFQLVKLSATENPLLSMDSTHSVRLRHWVRRRLDALQDRLSASQSERFDQQVLALQREVLGSAGIEYLQSFNFYFGAHPTSAAVKQEMVGRLTAAGERLERIALLEQLANTSDPARQRAAAAQLALLYEELANFGQAAEYFHQLRARWPNEVCWQGKTGAQLFDSLATDSPIRQRAAKHRWPTGKVLLKQGPAVDRARHMGYQPALPVKMLNPNAPAAGPVIVDQKQSFRISGMDHFGKVEWSVPLDQDKKESRMSLMANPGLSCGRTAGPLLVVAVGQQVMAIDTLKARHMGGESPILWRQDTLPAGSNARAMSLKNVRRNAKRPWTDESPNQHTPKLQISRIGPITDGGVTFVRHRDLISVDPTTGEVLWTRKGVERESQLFGDQQLIMVLPPGQKEVQVLSAIDGRLLGVREVPAEKDCWTTVGRHILVWRKVAGVAAHWELAFYDPWTQEDVWTHPMSLGTKGQLVGGDAVALFEKTKGRFVVLDLFTGERLVDELLDPDPQLKGIYVVRSRDFYMLVTNRGAPYNRSSRQIQIQPIPNGVGSAFISGSIYAFDRLTGKPLWDLPAKVQQWGLPRQQPVDLPVLVFSRRVTDRSKNRYHMSFLFMDKRTGRLVVPPGKRSNREYNFEIEGDAEKNIVSVLFKNSTLSLQFTDTPVPPAGPVQLPAEALVEKGGITSVIGAVLKAIGKVPAIPGAEDLFEGDAEVIENDKLPK